VNPAGKIFMDEQQAVGLKLTVTNPTVAGGGATIDHCFSVRGGSIGTAASDTWRLSPTERVRFPATRRSVFWTAASA